MTTRTWLLMLGLLATATLQVPPGLATHAGDGVHAPHARVGDQAVYHEAAPAGADVFAFEWLEPVQTKDRWGNGLEADVLGTLVPASLVNPEAPPDKWAELHEAYAALAEDPVWRTVSDESSFVAGSEGLIAPGVTVMAPAMRHITRDENVTWAAYAPPPHLRSCLAHHGLQGRPVAPGDLIPLAVLCPAAERLGVVADAQPARATTFLGRHAVELAYDVREGAAGPVDVGLPAPGTLRLVVAHGLAFLAEVEARGQGQEGWRYVLSGFNQGAGAVVPPWLQGGEVLSSTSEARFTPLGPDGPEDGGSALPYRLEEALANVRADPTLLGLRAWLRSHPEAFLVRADLWMGKIMRDDGSQTNIRARWELTFGQARTASEWDVFVVQSHLDYAPGAPRLMDRPLGAAVNTEQGREVREMQAERPAGQGAIDVGSALRAWAKLAPEPLNGGAVSGVVYEAPAPGRPAFLTVWSRFERSGGPHEVSQASVRLDASNGAATDVVEHHQRTTYGGPNLHVQPVAAAGGEQGPVVPMLAGLEVVGVGLTAAAVVAALLAKGGYLTVLYSRLKGSELLDNPRRRRVYDLIKAKPGIHLKALAASAGLGYGATVFHVRVLEKGGVVTHVSLPGYRRHYLTGSIPPEEMQLAAALEGRGSARTIYEAVLAEPGITLTELAGRAGVSVPVAHRTVERLRSAGLLDKVAQGREVRITARAYAGRN